MNNLYIDDFLMLILEHVFMTLSSVFLAIIVAVPLAVIIYKKNFHVNFIVNLVSILQSFPTLGVFAIIVPFLGIGRSVAIFTMFLYAILPIFINTIQGFKSINPEYYTIINSLNISKKDIFFKIEMPLIIPSIIGGIRITTTYTLSLVTIATLIGAGGLGNLIYLGLQQLNLSITILGIVPIILLTLIANYIFNYIEQKLLPADQRQRHVENYE